MLIVVSYDIIDDRRRYRLQKLLKGYGQRVQKSVFECDLNTRQIQELRQRGRALIKPEVDSIRYYALCAPCRGHAAVDGCGKIQEEQAALVI